MERINFINLMQSAGINLQSPVKLQLILHLRISQRARSTLSKIRHYIPFTPPFLTLSLRLCICLSLLCALANLTFS